jgi:hypothetical protein
MAIRHTIQTTDDVRHTTYDHLNGILPPYEPHTIHTTYAIRCPSYGVWCNAGACVFGGVRSAGTPHPLPPAHEAHCKKDPCQDLTLQRDACNKQWGGGGACGRGRMSGAWRMGPHASRPRATPHARLGVCLACRVEGGVVLGAPLLAPSPVTDRFCHSL